MRKLATTDAVAGKKTERLDVVFILVQSPRLFFCRISYKAGGRKRQFILPSDRNQSSRFGIDDGSNS